MNINMKLPKKFIKSVFVPCLVSLYLFPATQGLGQEHPGNKGPDAKSDSKWSTFIRGGYVHQFDTDIDDSKGSFASDRLFIQPGITYAPDHTRSFSLAIGYGYDGYDFQGETGFNAAKPWDDIHSFRFSTPIRVNKGPSWSFFVVPTLRITGESGADISDSLTGGGFAGFAYRFNKRFSIGPGIGIVTQIEDDASIFPVLIINWKITDRLSFETGRGIGATLGPGISLNWKITEQYHFSLGGRYEKLRFRLDDAAETPKGIGQDESFPVFVGITYKFRSSATISLIGGIETGGELQLEDQHGNVLEKQDYESAPFFGFSFSYRR
jgi:hypothetical protein